MRAIALIPWSAEDAAHAKQDTVIGGLTTIVPPVSEVMITAGILYGITSETEGQAYNSLCQ